MRVVIQRVKKASVTVDGELVSEIGQGLLTLFGVAKGDPEDAVGRAIDKLVNLRIFEDEAGKMNLSLLDTGFSHLIIPQFTLLGDCSAGRRPSFVAAEDPGRARELYVMAVVRSETAGVKTLGGRFGAHMSVELENDGPVTFVLEF